MIIDTQNTFFWKKEITANTNSDVVMNGNGGDAAVALWLYIRLDKDVTGTPLMFTLLIKKIWLMLYC